MIVTSGSTIRFSVTELARQAGASFHGELRGRAVQLDHVVRIEPHVDQLFRAVDVLVSLGGVVVETPHRFPVDVCEVAANDAWAKWMATVAVDDGLLVLAAPLGAHEGQLGQHLRRKGLDVPHHVAVAVADLDTGIAAWEADGWTSGPSVDDGTLGQVFLHDCHGNLLELIVRHDAALATFTCGNVLALSAAEDELRARSR